MVRVRNTESAQKLLLKNFKGKVVTMDFACRSDPILAVLDRSKTLHVFKISLNDPSEDSLAVQTILVRNVYESHGETESQTLCWCPWIPNSQSMLSNFNMGPPNTSNLPSDPSLLLAVSCGTQAKLFIVDEQSTEAKTDEPSTEAMASSNGAPVKDIDSTLFACTEDHANTIVNIQLSRDASLMATACLDGVVRLFSLLTDLGKIDDVLVPIHVFSPHDGLPLYGMLFLDESEDPKSMTWTHLLTGAQYNRELRLWSISDWTCVQTIRFCSASPTTPNKEMLESTVNTTSSSLVPSVKPSVIMAFDWSRTLLIAADITRRVLYVLNLTTKRFDEPTAIGDQSGLPLKRFSSISEFLLTTPCILFALGPAEKKLSPEQHNEGTNSSNLSPEAVSIEIHTIHTWHLLHGTINFQLPSLTNEEPWDEVPSTEEALIEKPIPSADPILLGVDGSGSEMSEFTQITGHHVSTPVSPFQSQEAQITDAVNQTLEAPMIDPCDQEESEHTQTEAEDVGQSMMGVDDELIPLRPSDFASSASADAVDENIDEAEGEFPAVPDVEDFNEVAPDSLSQSSDARSECPFMDRGVSDGTHTPSSPLPRHLSVNVESIEEAMLAARTLNTHPLPPPSMSPPPDLLIPDPSRECLDELRQEIHQLQHLLPEAEHSANAGDQAQVLPEGISMDFIEAGLQCATTVDLEDEEEVEPEVAEVFATPPSENSEDLPEVADREFDVPLMCSGLDPGSCLVLDDHSHSQQQPQQPTDEVVDLSTPIPGRPQQGEHFLSLQAASSAPEANWSTVSIYSPPSSSSPSRQSPMDGEEEEEDADDADDHVAPEVVQFSITPFESQPVMEAAATSASSNDVGECAHDKTMVDLLNALVVDSRRRSLQMESVMMQLKETREQLQVMTDTQAELMALVDKPFLAALRNENSQPIKSDFQTPPSVDPQETLKTQSSSQRTKSSERGEEIILQLRTQQGDYARRFSNLEALVNKVSAQASDVQHQLQQRQHQKTDPRLDHIPKLTVDMIRPIVRSEVQNAFVNNAQRLVEPLQKSMLQAIQDCLTSLPASVSDSLSRLMRDKTFSAQFSRTLSTQMSADLGVAYRDALQRVFVPALDRNVHKLFEELNLIFRAGTQQYLDEVKKRGQSTPDQSDMANRICTKLMPEIKRAISTAFEDSSSNQRNGLAKSAPNPVPDQVVRQSRPPPPSVAPINLLPAVSSSDAPGRTLMHSGPQTNSKPVGQSNSIWAVDRGGHPVNSTPPTVPSANLPRPAVAASTGDIMGMRSESVKRDEFARLLGQAKDLIDGNNLVDALELALVSTKQALVLEVCGLINLDRLFAPGQPIIGQNILLSLIHQLSCGDLSTQLNLKLNFLQAGVLQLNKRDATTMEHGPRIVNLLIRRLDSLLNLLKDTPQSTSTFSSATEARIIKLARCARCVFKPGRN